jgi:hypothetical protein
MKSQDNELNRLFKAAASAPNASPGAARFALEARVLGAWRAAGAADNGEFLVAWFRRAAICGAVLAVASLAWTYHAPTNRAGGEGAVADSAMGMGVE